jgi:hypothetical protein
MKKGIDDISQKCLVCGRDCKNRRSLANHVNRSHKEFGGLKGYVLKYMTLGEAPKCLCGCEREARWNSISCKFNDYITGHNEGFTSDNQPKFTKEQIEFRNEKIRSAYSARGDEIKQKISVSVQKTMSDPSMRAALSEAQCRAQARPEIKQKVIETRKRVWREQHDELCEKIFTEEFSRKISLANATRKFQPVSQEEEKFGLVLKEIFGEDDVVPHKSIVSSGKAVVPDFYVKSIDTYVDFDGYFWHGLDREDDFTFGQLVTMTNDIQKNSIMSVEKLNYVRINSNSSWQSISTWESLLTLAYHIVDEGNVSLEGTFKFRNDDHPIITREWLIKNTLKDLYPNAVGKEKIESDVLPLVKKFFRSYVEYWGWIYPETKETLEESLTSLNKKIHVSSDKKLMSLEDGTSYLKERMKSFWNVVGGPVDAMKNDKMWDSVVRYRVGLNNSKMYTYKLSDDTVVSCNEMFNITPKTIRKGFIVQRHSVSWFKPSLAADVYRRFLTELKDPVVWDPSCGFGARLLGFSSVISSGTYVGCEPASMTHSDLSSLSEDIKSVNPNLTIQIHKIGSEKIILNEESVDLVFTSPPYYDKEKYFDEEGQCWRDHKTLEEWTKKYVVPTLTIAHKALKKDGRMVLNVSSQLKQLFIDVSTILGFELIDELLLKIGRDHFSKSVGQNDYDTSEPVLVFRKKECDVIDKN